MENKQTAVEWLEEKVDNMILNGGDTDLLAVIEHIEAAKAMFEEQIKRAYNQGVVNEISIYSTISEEEYYNKTYGK